MDRDRALVPWRAKPCLPRRNGLRHWSSWPLGSLLSSRFALWITTRPRGWPMPTWPTCSRCIRRTHSLSTWLGWQWMSLRLPMPCINWIHSTAVLPYRQKRSYSMSCRTACERQGRKAIHLRPKSRTSGMSSRYRMPYFSHWCLRCMLPRVEVFDWRTSDGRKGQAVLLWRGGRSPRLSWRYSLSAFVGWTPYYMLWNQQGPTART